MGNYRIEKYWIHPAGEIIQIQDEKTHFIRDNLELFGISLDEYEKLLYKYSPKGYLSYQADIDLQEMVIENGWIWISCFAESWKVELWDWDQKSKVHFANWLKLKFFERNKLISNSNEDFQITYFSKKEDDQPKNIWLEKTKSDKLINKFWYLMFSKRGKILEFYPEYISHLIKGKENKFVPGDDPLFEAIWENILEKDFVIFTKYIVSRNYKKYIPYLSNLHYVAKFAKCENYFIEFDYKLFNKDTKSKLTRREDGLIIAKPEDMDLEEFIRLIDGHLVGKHFWENESKIQRKDIISLGFCMFHFKKNLPEELDKMGYYIMYPYIEQKYRQFIHFGDFLPIDIESGMNARIKVPLDWS
ncbi:MAG: hypothetical protein NT007_00380 [Candidatus Kapabacteria bacterium]|nr:hypothetical protein [Candidatus Kapabacteria bacterium]